MNVRAVYNSRKPNGDVSNICCDHCGKIGAAYIKLAIGTSVELICKGCLSDWDKMINTIIMDDIMDSVCRRGLEK